MKTVVLATIFFASQFFHQSLKAQVELSTYTCNAGGDQFHNSDFTIEWSIGEMVVVNTSFTPELIVSKGVLQPQRPRNIVDKTTLSLKVYPTITNGHTIFVSGNYPEPCVISSRIYNSIGQLLSTYNRNLFQFNSVQTINLPPSSAGEYFLELRITTSSGDLITNSTFRIQKF